MMKETNACPALIKIVARIGRQFAIGFGNTEDEAIASLVKSARTFLPNEKESVARLCSELRRIMADCSPHALEIQLHFAPWAVKVIWGQLD